MALFIRNRTVTAKIEALARALGSSKTAAVEKAVDRMLAEQEIAQPGDAWERFDAILAQIDRIPVVPGGCDPLAWDGRGLPR